MKKLRDILKNHGEFYNNTHQSATAENLRKIFEGFLQGKAEIDSEGYLRITMFDGHPLVRTFWRIVK